MSAGRVLAKGTRESRVRRQALIACGRRVEEIVGDGPAGAVVEFPA